MITSFILCERCAAPLQPRHNFEPWEDPLMEPLQEASPLNGATSAHYHNSGGYVCMDRLGCDERSERYLAMVGRETPGERERLINAIWGQK